VQRPPSRGMQGAVAASDETRQWAGADPGGLLTLVFVVKRSGSGCRARDSLVVVGVARADSVGTARRGAHG
jgi:hypothetical protein